jgi:hypothetical protein
MLNVDVRNVVLLMHKNNYIDVGPLAGLAGTGGIT